VIQITGYPFITSPTLVRRKFVLTYELVAISVTCVHSCRMSYVCANFLYVYFLSLFWKGFFMDLSDHEDFGHAIHFCV